jgi:cell division protein FtsQ
MAGNKPIENTRKPRRGNVSIAPKKVLILLFALFGISLISWLVWINLSGSKKFTEVSIEIKPLPNKINFLTKSKVKKIIDSALLVVPFKKAAAEYALEQNPYVKNAEVYINLDKTLHCKIEQREPIARVINQKGQHFYLDNEGNKFSCQTGTSARVVVINGFISEKLIPKDSLKTVTIQEIFTIASKVNSDVFWKQFTEQIFVDKYNDIILIPKVGNFTIVLGNSSSLDTKLNNLRTFIQDALPKVGWDKYKKVSVKYKGQIVTTKRQ